MANIYMEIPAQIYIDTEIKAYLVGWDSYISAVEPELSQAPH